MKLYEKTLHQLRDLLSGREVSAVEVAESVLARVEQTEPRVGAYLTVEADRALEAAKRADKRLADGDAHALTGIPVGVKDNISTRDVKTTAGSRMLAHYVPPYDATVVSRLHAADAPMVGKLNMDEFAMGSTTETSAFQLTRNPYDTTRTPGGSSGGSGAAVAAGSAVFSLGTDTGGSVRLPAAYCGLVGVKPTYGRISRYGVLPMAPSFDVVGPLTKDVRDAAIVLQALSGKDARDGTGIDADVPDYEAVLGQSIDGLVVGVPEQWLEGVAPDVLDSIKKAIDVLASLGADVRQVSLPHLAEATAMYRILVSAEVSSVMARYDGVRFGSRAEGEGDVYSMFAESRGQGFGEEVKRRILRGTYALTGDNFNNMYVAAQKARALLKRDFDRVFEEVALLVSPTSARVAPKLSGEAGTEDDAVQYTDTLTVPMNLTGVPALSMPCGTTESGLPIGLQLTAPAMQEGTLLQAAYALEEALGIGVLRPEL